jgi:hypothetical protein
VQDEKVHPGNLSPKTTIKKNQNQNQILDIKNINININIFLFFILNFKNFKN